MELGMLLLGSFVLCMFFGRDRKEEAKQERYVRGWGLYGSRGLQKITDKTEKDMERFFLWLIIVVPILIKLCD